MIIAVATAYTRENAEKTLKKWVKKYPSAQIVHQPETRLTNERWLILVDK